jgi:predicted Abi (CAAX) family protease
MGQQRFNRYGWLTALTLVVCLCISWPMAPRLVAQEPPVQEAFADPAQYPAGQFPHEGYVPVAAWSGRLILPNQAAATADEGDWVWMEILTSPNPELVGQRARLQWRDTSENQAFLSLVTRAIQFDEDAIASLEKGTVLPTRLDGWARVGPLQSLAGTRPRTT